jgi:hypothetical protein
MVKVLLAHELAKVVNKIELEWAMWHLACEKSGSHPNKDQTFGHGQKVGEVHIVHNPNTTSVLTTP